MTLDILLPAAAAHSAELEARSMYRDYHEGRHLHPYASDAYRRKFDWTLAASVENLCPAVVAAHTDRLIIESWGDPELAEHHGLDRLARLVHDEAHVQGNAYAIVWTDPSTGEPRATFQPAEYVQPAVDPERPDRLKALTRFWLDPEGTICAAVYDAHQVTRWHAPSFTRMDIGQTTCPRSLPTNTSAWQPREADHAPHVEPHSFGVTPAVWWKRRAPSQYAPGVSILRDMIRPQDRLNKLNADILAASERTAMPIRYLLSVMEEQLRPRLNPETGKIEQPKSPLDETQNTLLLSSAGGPAGQFPGPDVDRLLKIKNDLEAEIARITGVPMYYLAQTSGDVPSGESLRVVTARLTSAVAAFAADATPAWKGLLELLGATNPTIKWADPQPVSAVERIDIAERKLRIGYSMPDAIAGLDEADPEGIIERAKAAKAAQAESVGRALAAGKIPAAY